MNLYDQLIQLVGSKYFQYYKSYEHNRHRRYIVFKDGLLKDGRQFFRAYLDCQTSELFVIISKESAKPEVTYMVKLA